MLRAPLIWVKEIFKRGNIYGIGTYATSHNYPLIMSFSVEEKCRFHTRIFKKNLPTVGGGHPPPPPPPSLAPLARARSLCSLAYYRPPPQIKSWLRHAPVRLCTLFWPSFYNIPRWIAFRQPQCISLSIAISFSFFIFFSKGPNRTNRKGQNPGTRNFRQQF